MIQLVLAMLAGAALVWSLQRTPAARTPASAPVAALEAVEPPAEAPRESSTAAPPPPVSAGAPPGCPEDEEDPPGFVRPSLWDVLSIRTQELRDRLPQLSRDASEPMRAGLRAMREHPLDAIEQLRSAPDRDRDGFDVAVAGATHMGMGALAAQEARTAHRIAAWLAREAPHDEATHVFEALVAERAHARADARRALEQAYALAPDEPAIALAAARAASDAGDFEGAAARGRRYLDLVPEDTRVTTWTQRMDARAEMARALERRTFDGVTLRWPRRGVTPERVDGVQRALTDALEETATLTGERRRDALTVVIWASRDDMRRATCAPAWSGGIFDGVLHLDVQGVTAPDWARTARHEATHAQLAEVDGPIPHWLNEGLAQHLEGPPRSSVLRSWQRMVERGAVIPFASLEGQLLVIDDPDDARLAYHQSLAMFAFLLERRGARGVREAFSEVEAGRPEDILSRLVPGADGAQLRAFLARR
ncbi:MAG: hypothetical protein SangKO_058810 [Sandaracinaceae bacterium]